MVSELTWEEDTVKLWKLGLLNFRYLSIYHHQKEARLTLHLRAHISIKGEFDFGHFSVFDLPLQQQLGLFTEAEFLSEPNIGLLSSSKLKFRDQYQTFWLGITPGKSNPSLTPGRKNPKLLKLIIFGTFTISWDWRRLKRWNFHRMKIKSGFTLFPN